MSKQKGQALLSELGPLFDEQALLRHPSLTPGERKRMEAANWEAFDRAMAHEVKILTASEYPEAAVVEAMPPALFVHGSAEGLHAPTVGIVGTRDSSTYGKACAHKFAEAMARAGVTVVSGGALGIDAAAHRGALAGNGKTVAVLAGGVDREYPPVHATLFAQMRQLGGATISQFAVGSRPSDYKFLYRNDLIAALCEVILVIEAPYKSGALRTASTALDLGREVMVVPANIDMRDFRGSFNLIRDGAALVYHPDQVLEALGVEPARQEELASDLNDTASLIMSVLTVEPISAEKIVELTGLETSDVLSELTILELENLVIRDIGGFAKRP